MPTGAASYNLTIPCPGQGGWDVCAWANACNGCGLCKVCGHCQPSCPEYIDLTASSPLEAVPERRGRDHGALKEPSTGSRATSASIKLADKERKKKELANETPAQREARLKRMREYSASRRANVAVKIAEKEKKREERAKETPEQRESRLNKAKEYCATRRREEVKEAWQKYERKQKEEQRKRETSEQREARLQRMRDYSSVDKEWDKTRKRAERAAETDEQRDARLHKMKEYNAQRKANKRIETADEASPKVPQVCSAKEREKTRKRVAAYRANRTTEQVAHDREVSKKGMDKLRANRKATEDFGDH